VPISEGGRAKPGLELFIHWILGKGRRPDKKSQDSEKTYFQGRTPEATENGMRTKEFVKVQACAAKHLR